MHYSGTICHLSSDGYLSGFAFSRASYLLSLLRPQIVRDLKLKVSCGLRAPVDAKTRIQLGILFLFELGLWPEVIPPEYIFLYASCRLHDARVSSVE